MSNHGDAKQSIIRNVTKNSYSVQKIFTKKQSNPDSIPIVSETTNNDGNLGNYKTIMCRYGKNCVFGERCRYKMFFYFYEA